MKKIIWLVVAGIVFAGTFALASPSGNPCKQCSQKTCSPDCQHTCNAGCCAKTK